MAPSFENVYNYPGFLIIRLIIVFKGISFQDIKFTDAIKKFWIGKHLSCYESYNCKIIDLK